MSGSHYCPGCLRRGKLIHYSPQQEECAVCGESLLLLFPPCQQEAEPPSADDLLRDPACSYWLRHALNSALARDPVDAANDAEVLAMVLDARCRMLLGDS